ncbi:TRAP transporter small permease [Marinobacterium aestuariivivens]|uniref:TRAP transporter small permease protein n=1 Tax=Marinobacterium aestuariivivens TaxID=1698799 RepID=A0ABW2AAM7_9GAMM
MTLLRNITLIIGALCLSIMTLVTVADVAMRYLFTRPIFGSGEMIQYLLAVCVFAGMFVVNQERGHVHVSLFEPFFKQHVPNLYRWVFDLFSLLGVIGVTAILIWRAVDLIRYPESSIVLGWSLGLIVSVLATLSALSVLAALHAIYRRDLPGDDTSPETFSD